MRKPGCSIKPNKYGTHICKKCGERFRLKGTLNAHKKGHCPAEHLVLHGN